MRKPIIAANWKMNMTLAETEDFYGKFTQEIGDFDDTDIVIAPPFTALAKLSQLLGNNSNIRLAAQNFYFEKSGAYTGEVSAEMLRELYVRYVIIGHSERRSIFGETDEVVNKKMHAAFAFELLPILCVGETLDQREAGEEKAVLEAQIKAAFVGITAEQAAETVVAYEPVWAIGTGKTATSEQAQDAHAHVRSVLAALYGQPVADKVRIQYGGSVKPANAVELLSQPDIDGALVGGAALEPKSFADIVKAAKI